MSRAAPRAFVALFAAGVKRAPVRIALVFGAALTVLALTSGAAFADHEDFEWAGRWDVTETLLYESGGEIHFEKMSIDLSAFEAQLPDWAQGLVGRSADAGSFYRGDTNLTQGSGVDETISLFACELSPAQPLHDEGYALIGAMDYFLPELNLFAIDPGPWNTEFCGYCNEPDPDDTNFWGTPLQMASSGELSRTEWWLGICREGPCLTGAAASTGPGGGGGSSLIWIFGPLAAAGIGGAILAARARGRPQTVPAGAAPQAPPPPTGPASASPSTRPEQVVVHVSSQRVEVTSTKPATLTVTGYLLDAGGVPRPGDVSIRIDATPKSGLAVSPSEGRHQVVADVRLASLPEVDDVRLTITGSHGQARGRADVAVDMKVDHELQLF